MTEDQLNQQLHRVIDYISGSMIEMYNDGHDSELTLQQEYIVYDNVIKWISNELEGLDVVAMEEDIDVFFKGL